MTSHFTLSAAPALLAVASMISVPAHAADLPLPVAPTAIAVADGAIWTPGEDDTASNHRRYRGYRGYRGYRDDDIDADDVLAGVLIIGGIAAIASAASRSSNDNRNREDYRYRQPGDYRDSGRYPDSDDYRYRNGDSRRGDAGRGGDARGLNRAVEMCVDAVERDQRVDRVNSVDRNGRGWTVTGSLFNGTGFSCSIGEDGRVESINTGNGAYRSGEAVTVPPMPSGEDRQWDDDRYAAERARMEAGTQAEVVEGPQPSYPGGPLEGEQSTEDDLDVGTGYGGATI